MTAGRQLNEGSLYPHELLAVRGRTETEQYLVKEVQAVYKSQGVDINDKHIELIVRQMLKKVRVDQKGDTEYLPGQFVDRFEFARARRAGGEGGGEPAEFEDIILGITKASLNTDSFLSAASFQETTKVLTDAALEGKIDRLNGLKENVIIGKLIPAATGLKRYRRIEIEPAKPLPRAVDELGLLGGDDLASELGMAGFADFEADLASLEEIGLGLDPGFADELARARRRRPRLSGARDAALAWRRRPPSAARFAPHADRRGRAGRSTLAPRALERPCRRCSCAVRAQPSVALEREIARCAAPDGRLALGSESLRLSSGSARRASSAATSVRTSLAEHRHARSSAGGAEAAHRAVAVLARRAVGVASAHRACRRWLGFTPAARGAVACALATVAPRGEVSHELHARPA